MCARFSLSRPLSNSKISERAPRSGKAATLRTHQVGSRHPGCATPGAFRHRKHAHERRARARLCQLFRRLALPACMKRSGAKLPLCTWSGCGGRLNGLIVATVKRRGGGDVPHCAVSRCASINGRACCLQSSAAASIGRQYMGCCMWRQSVGCWMWYACQLDVWWSTAARNARRRPWKPNVNQ